MSAEKYSAKPEEEAYFDENVKGMMIKLGLLFQQGIKRLDFGMDQWKNVDKKTSFDPSAKPQPLAYLEKNYYIDASNDMWYIYAWHRWKVHPSISELYYTELLRRIKEFAKNNDDFNFNKGIVYANLGVAQSAQMKLDEGFANILKALIEDSGYSPNEPQYDLHRRDLFTQFEKAYVIEPLQRAISQLGIAENSSVEQFVEHFLESLNDDQRTFFDYTFARIMQNLMIWDEKNNDFTANRLLAYTQDFCLFIEDLLKCKISSAILSSRQYWTLQQLIPLPQKFSGINLNRCRANTMGDLNALLPLELGEQKQPKRCLRILLILRNYSSHNVGGGTSADCFYGRYGEILKELLRVMCYIILLPKPK